ncbi:MAG: glycosyltransferase family protein [Candidatus Diapherotrites archaeon]
MAKILFSVCGVGMGHATRSSVLIRHLMKDHKVVISSYGPAHEFLKKDFGEGQKLKWFQLLFEDNGYRKMKTMLYNAPRAPRVMASNLYKLAKFVKSENPDIIISDFDVNAVYIGEILKIPVITISSMHIMENIKIKMSMKDKLMYYSTEQPVLTAFRPSDQIFVTYYFKPGVKEKRKQFFGPLVRDNFINSRTSDGAYHLVYFPESELEKIIPVLKKFKDERFLIYGTDTKNKKGNLEFVENSHDQFYYDFANCSSVFSHGGISLTSEAIMLNKPIYTFSNKEFYERYFNGSILRQLGFGNIEETPTVSGIKSFITDIEMYKKEIKKADLPAGNREMLKALKKQIEKKAD